MGQNSFMLIVINYWLLVGLYIKAVVPILATKWDSREKAYAYT